MRIIQSRARPRGGIWRIVGRLALSVLAVAAPAMVNPALAATLDLYPTQSFEQAVESLAPGDTLIVHTGDYYDAGRISITVKGTVAQPVFIRAAEGETRPHVRRAAGAPVQNTINVEGATYLTIAGLEISSNGGDGINLNSSPAHVTLEDLEIHDVDVGINFRSSMNDIAVRRSQIYRTGAGGGGTGEGMYVGCNYAECVVRNSVIENNWIHDTSQSTQGDGIEIKIGSYGNVVRDNVIHDTGYPCILTYGTNGNPVNVVEGNVMWACGDTAIQTAADARIRNNIIFGGTSNGFNSQSHQGAVPGNLQFVHNTIVGGQPCVRLSGWGGRPGLIFANNAIYCEGGGFAVGDLTGVTVSGNVISPATSTFPGSGYVTGETAAADLVDPSGLDAYPTESSKVIGVGTPAYATDTDFNGNARSGPPEAGAYEWVGASNPGWKVQPGFKTAAAQGPQVVLTAEPGGVPAGATTKLSWSSTNAVSCAASGGWTGYKATTGSETVGPIPAATAFVLSCTSAQGGVTSRTVVVSIVEAPVIQFAANPTSVSAGGQSQLTWSSNGASSCTAGGVWAGTKPTSGSQQTGPLNATSTFDLECSGLGGSTRKSVTVTVSPVDGRPGDGSKSTGGGGSADLLLAALLISALASARARQVRIAGSQTNEGM